jgi:hypothetical protein
MILLIRRSLLELAIISLVFARAPLLGQTVTESCDRWAAGYRAVVARWGSDDLRQGFGQTVICGADGICGLVNRSGAGALRDPEHVTRVADFLLREFQMGMSDKPSETWKRANDECRSPSGFGFVAPELNCSRYMFIAHDDTDLRRALTALGCGNRADMVEVERAIARCFSASWPVRFVEAYMLDQKIDQIYSSQCV